MSSVSRPLAAARRAAADPITRSWAIVTAGSVARLGLGFVASVLIARELGVGDFGVYVSLGAVASIVGAVADFGLTEAAVKRIAEVWSGDETAARERGQVFFWVRLAAAAGVALMGVLLFLAFAAVVPANTLPVPLVALTLGGVVAAALSGAVSAMLQAIGRFGRLSAVMLVNSGATALAALALAYLGRLTVVTTLVVLGIGASFLSFGVGRYLLPRGWTLRPPTLARVRDETRRLARFAGWVGAANSLAMLAAYLDVLLVGWWSGATSAAFYGLALNLANKVDVVNQSLHAVTLPAAAGVFQADALLAYIRRSLLRSAAISVILLPLFWLAAPFIGFFYGATYLPAATTFGLLLAVVIFDIFTQPMLLLALPLNEPRLLAAADAVRVVVLVAVGVWLIPLYGANGAAIARLIARCVGVALVLAILAVRYRQGALRFERRP
ncbi:MAG: oligosaccharide flippase family protein [Anaerolineae bacterium]